MKKSRFKALFLSGLVLVVGCLSSMGTVFASSFTFGNDKIDIKDGTDSVNGFMYHDSIVSYSDIYKEDLPVEMGGGEGIFQDVLALYKGSLEMFYRVGVPSASLSAPYYLNGSATLQIAFNPVNIHNTFTVGKADLFLEPIVNDDLIIYAFNDNSSYNLIKIVFYFRNYCVTEPNTLIPLPEIAYSYHMRIKQQLYSEVTDLPCPAKIQVVSRVSSYDAVFSRTASPDVNIGEASIIHDAVLSAINGSSVSDFAVFMNLIYQQDASVYADVLNYLADISSDSENIKLYLMANLPDILSKVNAISAEQLRFNSAMYDLIYNYIYSVPSDTAAQSAMANESVAMASAASALEVSKPNIQALVQAPDNLINSDVKTSQNSIFAWVNHFRILPILLIVFTLAILSFVLYGKSG